MNNQLDGLSHIEWTGKIQSKVTRMCVDSRRKPPVPPHHDISKIPVLTRQPQDVSTQPPLGFSKPCLSADKAHVTIDINIIHINKIETSVIFRRISGVTSQEAS